MAGSEPMITSCTWTLGEIFEKKVTYDLVLRLLPGPVRSGLWVNNRSFIVANTDKSVASLAMRAIPSGLAFSTLVMQVIFLIYPMIFFVLIQIGFLPNPPLETPVNGYSLLDGVVFLSSWLSLILVSAASSSMGMFISFVSRLDSSAKLTALDQKTIFVSIHVFGSVFGVMLILLFLGDFVGGNLFPKLIPDGESGFRDLFFGMTYVETMAKVIVWTFIAGFSERLIPTMLENFASQLKKESEPKQDVKAEQGDAVVINARSGDAIKAEEQLMDKAGNLNTTDPSDPKARGTSEH